MPTESVVPRLSPSPEVPLERSPAGLTEPSSVDVESGVRDVIAAHLGVEPARIRNETYLIDLEADPLDLIEIVLGLESAFGIRLSSVSSARLRTVGDAVKLVTRHLIARG